MQTTITLHDIACCNCITHFAMDEELYRRRMDDGKTFWCPNGHAQVFTEPEIEKLKRENQALRRDKAWSERLLDKERNAHKETKQKLKNTNRRIAHGICPCCHRTFVNVARHMSGKHPDFRKDVS